MLTSRVETENDSPINRTRKRAMLSQPFILEASFPGFRVKRKDVSESEEFEIQKNVSTPPSLEEKLVRQSVEEVA